MQRDILIDKYLPHYTFNEYHEILIDSPIANVYDVDLSKSKTIAWLFKIRGLPTKRFSGLTRQKMLKIIKNDSENWLSNGQHLASPGSERLTTQPSENSRK